MVSLSMEEENYVRMGLLLTGVSPRAVRALFDHEFHPSCLDATLKKEYNKLLEMKNKHRISQPQWNLLFPRFPDKPMSNNFDVTLMITLLRNLTNVISPHGGFDKLPTSIETTTGSDLARIKYYRNYLAHLDDAKINNVFFVSAWDDISEAIGRLGGQSLKQECDQLKTKILDQTNKEIILEIKNSKSEIEELKTIVKDHESEMKKLKAEQNEVVPKNIRDQINEKIKDWEKRDQLFVSTRASDYVMKCLQDNSCVTLTGSAGVGKSYIARHTALALRKEGYSIIPVYSPSDIRVYYQLGKQTVFIVDDICGNFVANQQQIEKWVQLLPVINTIVKDKSCKIIVSCRLQVFKDDKFHILAPFKSFECNLISDELCLSAKEKKCIAEMYLGTNSKNLNEVAKSWEFFPLLCYLYQKKKDVDINEFFSNPFGEYQKEFDSLRSYGNEGKYKVCSLALCVLFNNELEDRWFQGKVTDEQRQLLEDTCEACNVNRCTSKGELREALDTLDGTFICKANGFYTTIHDKLFDFLAHYFGQIMTECLIHHGNSDLIHERVIWQKTSDDKSSNTEFIIEITDDYLEAYLKRLIKEWSDGRVTIVFNNSCMKDASCRQHLLQYLKKLDKSKQVALANTKDTMMNYDIHQSGDYPLIRSCKLGYTDMVQWMLHHDVDVDQGRDDGVTGLFMASQQGLTTILNLLLEKKPNVNLCDNEGWNPLYMASKNGHTDIVRLLLEKNPNVDQCDNKGVSPLYMASENGHTNIVRLLLEKNPNVDQCDKEGVSPLYMASENGHTAIVRLLLEKKPKVDKCDNEGLSPLYMASKNGHTDIVRLLLEKNHNVNLCDENGRSPLHMAIDTGYIDIVKLLLEKNPNVNLCDDNGYSPLYLASMNGYHKLGRNTLDQHHFAYLCSDGFFTSNDQINIVKLILLHKADINAQTLYGGHALFFSTLTGNLELTQLLLENNADCNICIYNKECTRHFYHIKILFEDNICQTLMKLLSSKMKEFVSNKDFEQKKQDILDTFALDVLSNRKQNVTYNTPFHFSELHDHKSNDVVFREKVVKYVFGVVAGSSPLHIACFMGWTDVVRCLLEYKANINLAKEDGTTPLSYACELGHTDIVQILLDQNANVDICDNDGLTPLIKSCLNNHTSTVQLLIKHKPDINASTVDGTNALFLSALNGNLEITKVLLENNADCNNCIQSKQLIIESLSGHVKTKVHQKKLDFYDILVKGTPNHINYITKCVSYKSLDYVFNIFAGSSSLHIACFMGRLDVVHCLLENKANINKGNDYGTTPLSYACEVGHTDIEKLLLDKHAILDSFDNDGFTPLIISCLNSNTSVVQLLIKHKPDINAQTYDGGTALFFSALNGNLEITQLLLGNSADCNICFHSKDRIINALNINAKKKGKKFYSLITSASEKKPADYFRGKYLNYETLNEGGILYGNSKSVDYTFGLVAGSSPLHIACVMGRTDVVRCLLDHNANINMTKGDGTTPLSHACELGHTDVVKMLLEKNANVNLCDNDGLTPLIKSCLKNHTSTVQLLIKVKPDINAKALHGLNALFFSAINGNLEIIQLLLKNGADCSICCDSKECVKDTSSNLTKITLKQKKQDVFTIVNTLSSIGNDYRLFMSVRDGSFDYDSEKSEQSEPYDSEEEVYVNEEAIDHIFNVVTDSSPLHIACLMGKTDVVRCLLEHKANINLTKEDGTTPLSYACKEGYTKIVKILLEKKANVDVSDNEGFSPLIKSCLHNHTSTVQLLIKHKPDINARTVDGGNALFFSALNGNQDITQILLQNNADCNICIYSQERMMCTFIDHSKKSFEQRKQDIFDIFKGNSSSNVKQHVIKKSLYQFWTKSLDYVSIRKKAVDYVFDVVAGSSPLHIACFMGRTKVVRCLLNHNANINLTKEDGTTPLSYACEVGHTDVVEMLLEKTANVDICDNNGFTPLIKACMNNNTSVVQLLIKHKSDINARALHGLNALFFSAINGNLEQVHLLLNSGADCNICFDSKEYIKDALTNRTNKTLKQKKQYIFDIVNNLLSIANDYDIDSDRVFGYGNEESLHHDNEESVDGEKFIDPVFDVVTSSTPLFIASCMQIKDGFRCLLEHTASIDMANEDGETSLFNACVEGHTDIVKLLLEEKANVNKCKNSGLSPLSIASKLGHDDIVRMLLEKNADVDLCDNKGFSPLLIASQAERNDIVKLLLQKNPNVDLFETNGLTTALFCSCFKDNSRIVELLIKHKPDINAQIIDGSCALFLSALHGNVEIVQLLLENNADCNICCHSKQSIIDKLTNNTSFDNLTQNIYVSYLKKASSRNVLDYVSKKMSKSKDYAFDVVAGSSPLHIACFNGFIDVVRCLLKHKANINMPKDDGTTPLFYACEVGHEDIVRLLLDNGADTQICRLDGKSPFDIATDNGHESVVILLC